MDRQTWQPWSVTSWTNSESFRGLTNAMMRHDGAGYHNSKFDCASLILCVPSSTTGLKNITSGKHNRKQSLLCHYFFDKHGQKWLFNTTWVLIKVNIKVSDVGWSLLKESFDSILPHLLALWAPGNFGQCWPSVIPSFCWIDVYCLCSWSAGCVFQCTWSSRIRAG